MEDKKEIYNSIINSIKATVDEHGWGYAAGLIIPGIAEEILTDGAMTEEILGQMTSKVDEVAGLAKTIRKVDKVESTVEILTDGSGVVTAADGTKYHFNSNVRNKDLAGKNHPGTGVHFDKNGFPEFDSKATYELPKEDYYKSNTSQFKYLDKQLYKDIKKGEIENPFPDDVDISCLADGEMPSYYDYKNYDDKKKKNVPYYSWHHNQEPGVMELVDSKIHKQTGYTDGNKVWGNANNVYEG